MSFFWRVAALNAAGFAVGGLLLAITPATVSTPIVASELAILVAGIAGLLVVNVLVLRWGFAPLARLVARMRRVDGAHPGPRLREEGPAEIRQVIGSYNAMIERLQDERRASARAAVMAQEAERERIARELHDEIGQSMTAVLMSLARALEHAPPESRDELARALEVARESLGDVQRVARRLRPESLEDLGLPSAVISLCRRFEEWGGPPLERHVELDLPRLPSERELVVYRVAQESLTNIARHAGASRASLRLERAPDGLALTVWDDGRGLDGAVRGTGIQGMRERAMLIGSELSIGGRHEGGVEVRLRVPIEEAA